MRKLTMGLVVLLALTACGGDDDASSDNASQDAQQVLDDREDAAATTLSFGETAEDAGIKVTVKDAEWAGNVDGGMRTLAMDVRFENTTDEDVSSPLISFRCRGTDETGNQHSGPLDPLDPLPAGTVAEGQAEMFVAQPCDDGWLEWDQGYDGEAFRWPMPKG